MQIELPDLFCLDKKQNLLISDFLSNTVRIFSKDGTDLHTIIIPRHGFAYPGGIVLTKNLKLIIVSDNINH